MKNNCFLLAATVLAFVSCSNNEPAPVEPINPAERVAVQFKGTAFDVEPGATRAESPWTQAGTIGIFALGETTADVMDGYANVGYSYNGSQRTFFPDGETIYYPVDGSKYRFAAYYPRQENMIDCIYKVDLTSQPSLNDQAAFELLWTGVTGAYNKTQPDVALNFGHQYAKISIKVEGGIGIEKADLKNIHVTMTDMYLTGDFNVVSGDMNPTGKAGELTFWRNADGSGQYALVMPTEANAGRAVNFSLGSDTFRWEIGNKRFEAGKSYTYTVTVNRTPLGLSATVTDWAEGDSDSGTAE